MLNTCKQCNSAYEALTGRSNFCSKPCKDKHWFIKNKEHKQEYYLDNIESIKTRERIRYLNKKEELNEASRDYYRTHSDVIKTKAKTYRKNNRALINKYHSEYYKNLNNKLRKNLRGRLSCAIKRDFSGSRNGSLVKDLGCSMQEFKVHIQSKFQPGMTWDNYGWGVDKWHLDHIKPLASFDLTNLEQFKMAANYTNYQPLWQIDNFKKGAR